MKHLAAALFFIVPTLSFAQEHIPDYQLEGYEFKAPTTAKQRTLRASNPDLKRFEPIEIEHFENKRNAPRAEVGSTIKVEGIRIRILDGLIARYYLATEDYATDCQDRVWPWPDPVVEEYLKYFNERNISMNEDELITSYCLRLEKTRVEE